MLFAQWKPVTYTVTYALGKGINAPENPKTSTTFDEIPLLAPQCKGSTFGGWWLRTPGTAGSANDTANCVDGSGVIRTANVRSGDIGVRPALRLDLTMLFGESS